MSVNEELFLNVKKRFYEAPFVVALGFSLTGAEPDAAEVSFAANESHRQQDGFIHAGVVSTLADHAGGAAGWTRVRADDTVLSAEFKITFLRPAIGPELLCRARVLKAGKRLIFTQAEVFDSGGALVAHMTQTLAVVKRSGSPLHAPA